MLSVECLVFDVERLVLKFQGSRVRLRLPFGREFLLVRPSAASLPDSGFRAQDLGFGV